MLCQLLRIQFDTYRQTLDDFDPVAGCVLRRQQGEGAARTHIETDNFTGIFYVIAVNIADNGRRLADTHVCELCFFEVGIYPQVSGRNNRHQRRGWANLCTRLYGATGYITGHCADNSGTFQRQPGIAHFGGSLLHSGLIFQLATQNHRLVSIILLDRDIKLGLSAGDGITSVLQLFAANQVGIAQRNSAIKVALCLRQCGFLHFNTCL